MESSRFSYFFVRFPPYSWSHRLKTVKIFSVIFSNLLSFTVFTIFFIAPSACCWQGQACSVTVCPQHPTPIQMCLCIHTFPEWSSSSQPGLWILPLLPPTAFPRLQPRSVNFSCLCPFAFIISFVPAVSFHFTRRTVSVLVCHCLSLRT